ncbi:AarF/UbiB family protein [Sphingomonas sp. RP10(2022)]|uniref:AarF/UbiB family protein n=1 Tax=Sphingomonas liriopis TaxID=2949094 RepID=A0A9X2KSW2_9SPHN|nr:AarF/UbiB family protein [Sphingomonas liriopis]MCP3734233.1 AarF/UbiB family protein [Sphingomonas liriopis]
MLKTLAVAGRDRARLAEMTQVGSRFGLGLLLARLGLAAGEADDGDGGNAMTLPARTRLALEALGPTFVKLGQILATRGDLLPPAWIAELEKLHSQAPTLAFADLRGAVEQALGQSPETAFAAFDETPLAAASMAQVHRATLHDGRAVVLKIQRPGVRPRIEADLRLLAQLASIVESASAEARRFAPTAMLRQLAAALLEELDFTGEGRNADRLRADFAGDPRVVVPDIHWQWSSPTLLVMDYVAGVPPRSGADLRAAGIDPAAIAALGADMVLDMVLVNGRFHGDPHPGNLLCLPGNRIALLDLGMIGHVSPRRRQEFISFMQSLTGSDPAQLADVLLVWSAQGGASREGIRVAAERLVARHGGGSLVLSAVVADVLGVMRQEGLVLPPDLLLIFKALLTMDGVLSAVEPGFDLSRAMRDASRRIVAARLSSDHWMPIVQAVTWELMKLGDDAPRLMRAVLRRLEADEPVAATPADSGRWIAGAIVLGAVIVAVALVFA